MPCTPLLSRHSLPTQTPYLCTCATGCCIFIRPRPHRPNTVRHKLKKCDKKQKIYVRSYPFFDGVPHHCKGCAFVFKMYFWIQTIVIALYSHEELLFLMMIVVCVCESSLLKSIPTFPSSQKQHKQNRHTRFFFKEKIFQNSHQAIPNRSKSTTHCYPCVPFI